MQVSYDAQHNIAYIRLKHADAQVQTVTLSQDVNVDLAPDGTLFGIELLNANEQIGDDRVVEVLNKATGQSQQLPLPE
jgi:uncharacterized protein YuzE